MHGPIERHRANPQGAGQTSSTTHCRVLPRPGDLCQHSPVHLGTSSPSPGQGQHRVLDSTAKQDISTSTLIVKLSSNTTWSQQGQAWTEKRLHVEVWALLMCSVPAGWQSHWDQQTGRMPRMKGQVFFSTCPFRVSNMKQPPFKQKQTRSEGPPL